jgi:mono/diheme cytochrome c family protein
MALVGLAGCGRGNDQAGKAPAASKTAANAPADVVDNTPDPDMGREIFLQGCVTCHGANAQGLPHQGASLRTSTFIASHSDKELIEFIKKGRAANDPTNRSGVTMPPDGNIPGLTDDRLADVVAYLRQVQREAKEETASKTAPGAAPTPQ